MFFWNEDKQMLLKILDNQNKAINDLHKTCRTLLECVRLARKRIEELERRV